MANLVRMFQSQLKQCIQVYNEFGLELYEIINLNASFNLLYFSNHVTLQVENAYSAFDYSITDALITLGVIPLDIETFIENDINEDELPSTQSFSSHSTSIAPVIPPLNIGAVSITLTNKYNEDEPPLISRSQ